MLLWHGRDGSAYPALSSVPDRLILLPNVPVPVGPHRGGRRPAPRSCATPRSILTIEFLGSQLLKLLGVEKLVEVFPGPGFRQEGGISTRVASVGWSGRRVPVPRAGVGARLRWGRRWPLGTGPAAGNLRRVPSLRGRRRPPGLGSGESSRGDVIPAQVPWRRGRPSCRTRPGRGRGSRHRYRRPGWRGWFARRRSGRRRGRRRLNSGP